MWYNPKCKAIQPTSKTSKEDITMTIIRITTTTCYPYYKTREEYIRNDEEADKRVDELAEELRADKSIQDWMIETV